MSGTLKKMQSVSQSGSSLNAAFVSAGETSASFLPSVEAPEMVQQYSSDRRDALIGGTADALTHGLDSEGGDSEDDLVLRDEEGNPVRPPQTEVPAFLREQWEAFRMDEPPAFTRFERIKTVLPSLGLLISVVLLAAAVATFKASEPQQWFDELTASWSDAPFSDVVAVGTANCPDTHPLRLSPGGVDLAYAQVTVPMTSVGSAVTEPFRLTHYYTRAFCGRRDAALYPPALSRTRVDPATGGCVDAAALRCGSSCYAPASDGTPVTQCPVTGLALETVAADEAGSWTFHKQKWVLRVQRDAAAEPLTALLIAAEVPAKPADALSFPPVCPGARLSDVLPTECPAETRADVGADDTWLGVARYDNSESPQDPELQSVCRDNAMPTSKKLDKRPEGESVALFQRRELVLPRTPAKLTAAAADTEFGEDETKTCDKTYQSVQSEPDSVTESVKGRLAGAASVMVFALVLYSVYAGWIYHARLSALPTRLSKHDHLYSARVIGAGVCFAATAMLIAVLAGAALSYGKMNTFANSGCFSGSAKAWAEGSARYMLRPIGLVAGATAIPAIVFGYSLYQLITKPRDELKKF